MWLWPWRDSIGCRPWKSIRRCRFRSSLWPCGAHVRYPLRIHTVTFVASPLGLFTRPISNPWKWFSHVRCDASCGSVCGTCSAVSIHLYHMYVYMFLLFTSNPLIAGQSMVNYGFLVFLFIHVFAAQFIFCCCFSLSCGYIHHRYLQ